MGTTLQRVIYHYWYHTGEAGRDPPLLGHTDLPEFVGHLGTELRTALESERANSPIAKRVVEASGTPPS